MNNLFKSNSRFDGLVDYDTNSQSVKLMKKTGWKEGKVLGKNQDGSKIPVEVEKRENNSGIGFKRDESSFNSFKDNGFRERRYNRPLSDHELQKLREEYKAQHEAKKRLEKQEEDRRNEESLQIYNFPELILHNNKNIIYDESYIEKLKSINEVESEHTNADPDLEKLKAGWIIMKKDILTGKTSVKGKFEEVKQSDITQQQLTQNIIDSLVDLHERRRQGCIDLNGLDTWEKMFKCKNWQEWEAKYESDFDSDSEDDIYSHEDTSEYDEY
jgi:hypothetical protein